MKFPPINMIMLKMNMKMMRWPMKNEKDSLILTQTGEANFLILIVEAELLILIMLGR